MNATITAEIAEKRSRYIAEMLKDRARAEARGRSGVNADIAHGIENRCANIARYAYEQDERPAGPHGPELAHLLAYGSAEGASERATDAYAIYCDILTAAAEARGVTVGTDVRGSMNHLSIVPTA